MKFESVFKRSFEVCGGLPGMAFKVVVFVAGPFDEILEFVVLDSRVEDFRYFPFELVLKDYRRRRWLATSRDDVGWRGFEELSVEDGVKSLIFGREL